MSPFLLYFGCWQQSGHFIYNHRASHVYDLPKGALAAEELDGSRIFLPYPEEVGLGQLSHLIRDHDCITVLAWWDRTFDKRGKCNAAIQCDGWETAENLWTRFARVYEPLAKQLTRPNLRVPYHYTESKPA